MVFLSFLLLVDYIVTAFVHLTDTCVCMCVCVHCLLPLMAFATFVSLSYLQYKNQSRVCVDSVVTNQADIMYTTIEKG